MAQRYFLCDQSLKSYSGHCYEYYHPLVELITARGQEVVLIGNKDMEESFANETNSLPVFTYWCDETNIGDRTVKGNQRSASICAAHEGAIIADFERIDGRFKFGAEDVIVLNSARHWVLKGLFRWLESVPIHRRPNLVILLHFTATPVPGEYHPSKPIYQEAFRYLDGSSVRSYVHLLADSQQLIDEYRSYTSRPVKLSPFPHTARALGPSNLTRGNINVGYVGEARVHKGFHLLPYLAKAMKNPNVHFQIHAFCFSPQAPFYRASIDELKHCSNVTLCFEMLNPTEYQAFLDTIDISLIPYMLDNYYRQTSGIYAESVALGKPVIVSRGTWMADQVRQFGGGECCIPNDFMSLTDCVERVVDSFDRYRNDARRAAQRWNKIHNPERLMASIDDQIALARPDLPFAGVVA